MSFEKKLEQFLADAFNHKVIDKGSFDKLQFFAKSDLYKNKAWLNFSSAIALIGALALLLGCILLIAHNWYLLSKTVKIIGFLAIMGLTHITGLYLSAHSYYKTSMGTHFLGSGLALAGIGLMAQIFNLHSNNGEEYLMWAIMITPLAFLLRNGPIALLSVISLFIWVCSCFEPFNTYIYLSFFMLIVLGGLWLNRKGSEVALFIQIPGLIGLMIMLYVLGFVGNIGHYIVEKNLHLVVLSVFITTTILTYLLLTNKKQFHNKYFLLSLWLVILVVIANIITVTQFNVNTSSYFNYSAFGHSKRVYLLDFFTNICAWLAYFTIAFVGVFQGSINQSNTMINSNIIVIAIGIFTRFIDLVGSMLSLSKLLLLSGLLLIAVGFILEKWRRKLVITRN